jgi:hypothetical protein
MKSIPWGLVTDVILVVLGLFVGFAIHAGLFGLFGNAAVPSPVAVVLPSALPASEPVTLTDVHVVTFAKAKTLKKLDLPKAVQDDTAKEVVAASDVTDKDGWNRAVSAVIDTKTGSTEIYAGPETRPFFAAERNTSVGLYAGLNENIEPTMRLQVSEDLARVGNAHLGAIASVDFAHGSNTTGFVGVGLRVDF